MEGSFINNVYLFPNPVTTYMKSSTYSSVFAWLFFFLELGGVKERTNVSGPAAMFTGGRFIQYRPYHTCNHHHSD